MNLKNDLPSQLRPDQSASNSRPASPLYPQPASSQASQPTAQSSPSLPQNDHEIETESDDDLPRMPDSSSEEEIDNPEEVHPEDGASLPNSQPLFQSPAPSDAPSNRRSMRYFKLFLRIRNYN